MVRVVLHIYLERLEPAHSSAQWGVVTSKVLSLAGISVVLQVRAEDPDGLD